MGEVYGRSSKGYGYRQRKRKGWMIFTMYMEIHLPLWVRIRWDVKKKKE